MTAGQRLSRNRFLEIVVECGGTPEQAREQMRKMQGSRVPRPPDDRSVSRATRILNAIKARISYRKIAEREGVSVASVSRIGKSFRVSATNADHVS